MILPPEIFFFSTFVLWTLCRRENTAAVTADDTLLADARSCTPFHLFTHNNSLHFEIGRAGALHYVCGNAADNASEVSLTCNKMQFTRKSTEQNNRSSSRRGAADVYLCKNILVKRCSSRAVLLGNIRFRTHAVVTLAFSDQGKLWSACNTTAAVSRRKQRETLLIDRKTKNCPLMLVADHLFFTNVGGKEVGATVQEMLAAVHFADAVFRSTDFDGDKSGDNTGFVVANITVIQTPDTGLKYSPSAASAQEYLDSFSRNDFGKYCLAVAFTYIDFADGVDAAAKIATTDPDNGQIGICSGSQFWRGEILSHNTLVVSYLNNGVPTPFQAMHLTLTHEFGHSFGSNHDSTADCSQDHYIMHSPSGSDGSVINRQFSACSIRQMHPVLVKQGHCLTSWLGPTCGNTIVEAGEECDCGSGEMCQIIDTCCTPADVPADDPDKPCTVRASTGAQCSGVASPCCTAQCAFVAADLEHPCREETDCSAMAVCSGLAGECPKPQPKADGMLCHQGSRICEGGLCLYSVCRQQHLAECLCTDKEDHCKVCCRQEEESTCKPASAFGIMGLRGDTVYRPQGASCADNSGMCNADHVCVNTDMPSFSSDPFYDDSQPSFTSWLNTYWKELLKAVLVLLLLVALFFLVRWRCSKKKAKTLEMLRLNLLLRLAAEQHRQCADSLHSLEHIMQHVEKGNKKKSCAKAIARLRCLFPSTPVHVLMHVAQIASTEEVAVRLLLTMEYPMAGSGVSKPSTEVGFSQGVKPTSDNALDTSGLEKGDTCGSIVCDEFGSALDVKEPSDQNVANKAYPVMSVYEVKMNARSKSELSVPCPVKQVYEIAIDQDSRGPSDATQPETFLQSDCSANPFALNHQGNHIRTSRLTMSSSPSQQRIRLMSERPTAPPAAEYSRTVQLVSDNELLLQVSRQPVCPAVSGQLVLPQVSSHPVSLQALDQPLPPPVSDQSVPIEVLGWSASVSVSDHKVPQRFHKSASEEVLTEQTCVEVSDNLVPILVADNLEPPCVPDHALLVQHEPVSLALLAQTKCVTQYTLPSIQMMLVSSQDIQETQFISGHPDSPLVPECPASPLIRRKQISLASGDLDTCTSDQLAGFVDWSHQEPVSESGYPESPLVLECCASPSVTKQVSLASGDLNTCLLSAQLAGSVDAAIASTSEAAPFCTKSHPAASDIRSTENICRWSLSNGDCPEQPHDPEDPSVSYNCAALLTHFVPEHPLMCSVEDSLGQDGFSENETSLASDTHNTNELASVYFAGCFESDHADSLHTCSPEAPQSVKAPEDPLSVKVFSESSRVRSLKILCLMSLSSPDCLDSASFRSLRLKSPSSPDCMKQISSPENRLVLDDAKFNLKVDQSCFVSCDLGNSVYSGHSVDSVESSHPDVLNPLSPTAPSTQLSGGHCGAEKVNTSPMGAIPSIKPPPASAGLKSVCPKSLRKSSCPELPPKPKCLHASEDSAYSLTHSAIECLSLSQMEGTLKSDGSAGNETSFESGDLDTPLLPGSLAHSLGSNNTDVLCRSLVDVSPPFKSLPAASGIRPLRSLCLGILSSTDYSKPPHRLENPFVSDNSVPFFDFMVNQTSCGPTSSHDSSYLGHSVKSVHDSGHLGLSAESGHDLGQFGHPFESGHDSGHYGHLLESCDDPGHLGHPIESGYDPGHPGHSVESGHNLGHLQHPVESGHNSGHHEHLVESGHDPGHFGHPDKSGHDPGHPGHSVESGHDPGHPGHLVESELDTGHLGHPGESRHNPGHRGHPVESGHDPHRLGHPAESGPDPGHPGHTVESELNTGHLEHPCESGDLGHSVESGHIPGHLEHPAESDNSSHLGASVESGHDFSHLGQSIESGHDSGQLGYVVELGHNPGHPVESGYYPGQLGHQVESSHDSGHCGPSVESGHESGHSGTSVESGHDSSRPGHTGESDDYGHSSQSCHDFSDVEHSLGSGKDSSHYGHFVESGHDSSHHGHSAESDDNVLCTSTSSSEAPPSSSSFSVSSSIASLKTLCLLRNKDCSEESQSFFSVKSSQNLS